MKKKDSIVCGNVGKLRTQYCSSWVEYFAVTRWTHSMGHHIHWCQYWVCGITSVPSDSQGKKVLTSFQGSWSITPIRKPQCYEQEKNATQAHMSLEYCWCIQLLTGTQQVNIINFCMSTQWLCSLLCMFSWGVNHWHSNTTPSILPCKGDYNGAGKTIEKPLNSFCLISQHTTMATHQ
jgi:hypothetical protein